MKYSCEVVVNVKREDCIKLWFDESRFSEWQDGFQSKNWIEGNALETNSKADILYDQNGRRLELIEHVVDNSLPDFYLGEYIHKHMTNTQKVIFREIDTNKTLVCTEVNYTQFNGLMPKLMGFLFPRLFRKQSQKWLDQFKFMVEE